MYDAEWVLGNQTGTLASARGCGLDAKDLFKPSDQCGAFFYHCRGGSTNHHIEKATFFVEIHIRKA